MGVDWVLLSCCRSAAEVLLGEGRIQRLLAGLRQGLDQVWDLAPFLPQTLVEDIQSQSFCKQHLEAAA